MSKLKNCLNLLKSIGAHFLMYLWNCGLLLYAMWIFFESETYDSFSEYDETSTSHTPKWMFICTWSIWVHWQDNLPSSCLMISSFFVFPNTLFQNHHLPFRCNDTLVILIWLGILYPFLLCYFCYFLYLQSILKVFRIAER